MRPRAVWRRRLGRVFIVWIALAFVALVYGMADEPRRLVQRDYRLAPTNWPARCDGLRIDHVSDIHTGSPGNGLDNLDRVVARLAASDSDAVVLSGVYVSRSVLGGGPFHRLGRGRVGGGFGLGGLAGFLAVGAFLDALLRLLVRLALLRVVAVLPLHHALLREEARDAVGRLGALADPFLDALQLEDGAVGIVLLQERVIGADLLDETAVAGRMAVGHHDRVVGALLGAATGQTDLQHSLGP